MEYKLFNLGKAQKKGSSMAGHATDYIVGALIVVILISVLAGTIFNYLGTGATGLGNSTLNPSVPSWLPSVLVIAVAVGLLYLVFKALGLVKR